MWLVILAIIIGASPLWFYIYTNFQLQMRKQIHEEKRDVINVINAAIPALITAIGGSVMTRKAEQRQRGNFPASMYDGNFGFDVPMYCMAVGKDAEVKNPLGDLYFKEKKEEVAPKDVKQEKPSQRENGKNRVVI